jgi:hypothetical protein
MIENIKGNTSSIRSGSLVERETLINLSDFTNQNPTGLDAPMTVTYGPSVVNTPEISYDGAGTFTCNKTGTYDFRTVFQYGRTGASGTSELIGRVLLNGQQVSPSILGKITNSNDDIPAEFNFSLPLQENDTVIFQIVRDSTGNDSGGLITFTPTLLDWDDVPSATIIIYQYKIK